MILLLWCVCGGFLQHFYDSSFLDILLKRNYEKPVDTAQDIIDRGLGVITYPTSGSWVKILKNSPSSITRTLAERTTVCKDWDECNKRLIPGAVKTGSSVVEVGILWPQYLELGRWHRSRDRKGGINPFGSYMLNKKWTLNEEFNNHMLRFQQVSAQCSAVNSIYFSIIVLTFQAGLTITEVGFKEEPEDDKPEPLRMEHFHLPLGLWFVGTLISLLCFIAELILHRKTNVPMARVEEPRVTQITAESENLGEMVLNKWKVVRLSDTEGAELDLAGSENIEDIEDTKVEV